MRLSRSAPNTNTASGPLKSAPRHQRDADQLADDADVVGMAQVTVRPGRTRAGRRAPRSPETSSDGPSARIADHLMSFAAGEDREPRRKDAG